MLTNQRAVTFHIKIKCGTNCEITINLEGSLLTTRFFYRLRRRLLSHHNHTLLSHHNHTFHCEPKMSAVSPEREKIALWYFKSKYDLPSAPSLEGIDAAGIAHDFIKCQIAVAKADGVVSKAEADFITGAHLCAGLPLELIQQYLAEVNNESVAELADAMKKENFPDAYRKDLVYNCIAGAAVDGFDTLEDAACRALAIRLGKICVNRALFSAQCSDSNFCDFFL